MKIYNTLQNMFYIFHFIVLMKIKIKKHKYKNNNFGTTNREKQASLTFEEKVFL